MSEHESSRGAKDDGPQPLDAEGQRRLEDWQQFIAERAEFWIDSSRALYALTRNPTHALEAYRIARHLKLDVPGWVLELFDQWAETLCVKRPNGTKAIADALGLGTKGGPSITLQARKDVRNMHIAWRVFALRDRDPKRDTLTVFDQVAEEFKLSSERISGIWYKLTRSAKR